MLGFPLLCFKGMRLMMFQLSSFHCKGFWVFGSLGVFKLTLWSPEPKTRKIHTRTYTPSPQTKPEILNFLNPKPY